MQNQTSAFNKGDHAALTFPSPNPAGNRHGIRGAQVDHPRGASGLRNPEKPCFFLPLAECINLHGKVIRVLH